MPATATVTRMTAGSTGVALVLLGALAVPAGWSPAVAATPTCQGVPATIVGTSGPDTIVGTKGPDVIVAGPGDDVIDARAGDDLVCAGMGSDRVDGGFGSDRIYGQQDRLGSDAGGTFLLGDVLSGGPGDDLIVGGQDNRRADARRLHDTVSYADAAGAVIVDLSSDYPLASGEGTDTLRLGTHPGVIGSAHDDTITGSDGPDQVDGGDGGDLIKGRGGDDTLTGESRKATKRGADTLVGGPGNDLLGSYTGRDRIEGGGGRDFVEAFSDRPAVVEAGGGADYVVHHVLPRSGARSTGGAGRDVLVSLGKRLEGRQPRASFHVDLRSGTTRTSTGARGSVGGFEEHRLVGNLLWEFHGTPGPDRVWALTGGPLRARTLGGDDWLGGSPRDDFLHGGDGTDTATTGGGTDTCREVERGC